MDLNSRARSDRLATVVDWVRGRLEDPEVERELTGAMPRDPSLRADVEWARRLMRTSSDLPLVHPPDLLRQRLRQQFRRWAASQGLPWPEVLELAATPVFDSRTDRLVVGMRGEGRDDAYVQLVWRTEVAEVIAQAQTQDDGMVRLDGQVLLAHPTASPVFEVVAHGPGVQVTVVDGDTLGRFHAVVPDTVDLLYLSNGEVALRAPITLTPP